MRLRRLLAPAGLILLVSACASNAPEKITEVRNYNSTLLCDGAKLVTVRFMPFAVTLEDEAETADMAQQPVAEGFLYKGQGQSLRAHGQEVAWTDAKGKIHLCQERPGPR